MLTFLIMNRLSCGGTELKKRISLERQSSFWHSEYQHPAYVNFLPEQRRKDDSNERQVSYRFPATIRIYF